MRAVRDAHLGKQAPKGKEEQRAREWQRRHIIEAVNEVTLMEVYGGYEALMNAPAWHVARTTLVLLGRSQADEKRAQDGANGGGGDGNGSGNGLSSTSAYDNDGRPRGRTFVESARTSRSRPSSDYVPWDDDDDEGEE